MALKMQSIQTSLCALSTINKPTFNFLRKNANFRFTPLFSSSSSSSLRTPMFCSCSGNSNDKYVLTTLYYVNAPPHMGSAYTTIAADAIARFQVSVFGSPLPWLRLLLLKNCYLCAPGNI
ncbi:hypothetical protein RND81_04G042400 [Saponaria officinalis]|uniref:Methionyl/Leucyl tRNA synthetase domain-containing protein n=1 Tax=Saponaria officinalis TaxID=3572 RepID=A0AAW1LHK8_SAPOF